MIALLGDIHGDVGALESACTRAAAEGATALIQVGDFGVYPQVLDWCKRVAYVSRIPIYFIDGNHEKFSMITPWWESMEIDGSSTHHIVQNKLIYVRRGSVLKLYGRRIGFLGGAASIDFAYRSKGYDWFDEEVIRQQDCDRLIKQAGDKPLDMLITHTPPQRIITKHFDNPPERALQVRNTFGAPANWSDPGAPRLDAAWEKLGFPMNYCGHMHRALIDGPCRILNINELVYV
jgi:Icc-related predicted phosphoesterase